MSFFDFQNRFPNEESCWTYLVKMRWPKGYRCPRHPTAKTHFKPSTHTFQCYQCDRQTSVTAGTLFHKSHLPLRKWFRAIFLMGTTPKGVSMRYLQKQLGIKSYRAVWLMGHKIRSAMAKRERFYRLKDIKNLPRFITFEQLETAFKNEVLPAFEKRIPQGSPFKSGGVGTDGQAQKKSDGLISTYHGCSPKYRKAYLAEFAYRFNQRYGPHQAFDRLLLACLHGPQKTLQQIKA